MPSRKVIQGNFGKKPKRNLGSILGSSTMRTMIVASAAFCAGLYVDDCKAVDSAVSWAKELGAPKVYVPRNDTFLYGMLRKIYVCKITDEGLTECVAGEPEG